jgi:hypothetical protein
MWRQPRAAVVAARRPVDASPAGGCDGCECVAIILFHFAPSPHAAAAAQRHV